MAAMGQKPAMSQTELQKLNDPNFLVELAIGPPDPALVPQTPGTGLQLGGQYSQHPRTFVYKKAHLSVDDSRVFDESGELVLVTHHPGKNPYDSLDPLGLANTDQIWSPFGEWQSICHGTGYNGMPDFRVTPKAFTRHGRQYVQDPEGNVSYCNIARQSRLKSRSIRHNLVVCRGDDKDVVYKVLVDMAGRTMQLVNTRDELEATITKSVKSLILNASFGVGSEMQVDVAPGVDWTAVLAILIGLKQVGQHYVKDAVGNFVVAPATNAATGAAVVLASDPAAMEEAGATLEEVAGGLGLEDAAGTVGETLGEAAEGSGEVIAAVFEFIGSLFE